MWEERESDGRQFPRFKATIRNITITCAFSKGEEIKNGAQIVQFSKRKRWLIVLLVV